MGKVKVKKVDYEGQLEDVIGFTADDIEANHAGQLSAEQHDRLMDREFNKLREGLVCGVICCVIGFYAMTRGIPSHLMFQALVLLGVLVYLGINGLYKGGRLYLDLNQGQIYAAEGYAHLNVTTTGKKGMECTVVVGGERFRINKNIFLLFKNGDPYTIYYLPRSKTILSVEWLRQ